MICDEVMKGEACSSLTCSSLCLIRIACIVGYAYCKWGSASRKAVSACNDSSCLRIRYLTRILCLSTKKMGHGTLFFCNFRGFGATGECQNVSLPSATYGTMCTLQQLTSYRASLEGEQTPIPFSTLIRRPDLRHTGSNIR